MIETACAMLDKVYDTQYNLACDYIMMIVEGAAGLNTTEVSISNESWKKECPLVRQEDLINELTMKGYKVELKDNNLIINWEGAEKLCRVKPYQSTHTRVTADTTLGSSTL